MQLLYTAPGLGDHQACLEGATRLEDVFDCVKHFTYHAECLVSQQVWRSTGTPVVIKSYTKCRLSKTAREQVDTELQIHAGLAHEHVTPLLLALEDDRCVHLVLQWADGGDLRQRLDNSPAMSERRVREMIVRPLLQALAVLEQQGVVHRDMKPDNVLLHQGKVQLADFGLAVYAQPPQQHAEDDCLDQQPQPSCLQSAVTCPASPPSEAGMSCVSSGPDDSDSSATSSGEFCSGSHTQASTRRVTRAQSSGPVLRRPSSSPDLMASACGTPLYTAPEVLLAMFESRPISQVVTHKNDVWGLGVIALEALLGSHPLAKAANLLYSVAHHKVFPLPSHLSPEAAHWLSLATHRDPAQRPSASQLLQHEWLQQPPQQPLPNPVSPVATYARLASLRVSVGGLPSPRAGHPQARTPRATPTATSLASSCKASAAMWSPRRNTSDCALAPDCWEY